MDAILRCRPLNRAAAILLCVVAALAASGAWAPAVDADEPLIHPTLREFYRTGKYAIYIDGKSQDDARIYQSRRAGAFLVVGSDHGNVLIFQPREREVNEVHPDQVALRPDGGVDVLNDAEIERVGELRIDRGGMAVRSGDLVSRLQPQPYLVGPKKAEDVLLHSPEYARAGASYDPSDADIRRIRSAAREVEVLVFFGTWCPTCRRLLPRILKVDEAIDGANIKITYYGLDKGPGVPRDPNLDRYDVRNIPTGVVLVDGRAVGQISSRDWSRPERALAGLVAGR